MWPVPLLIGLMIAAMWLVAVTSWQLRNWRAVSFVFGASAALLVAGLLPNNIAPWAQAAVWGLAIWVLLLHTQLFPAMTSAEYEFVDKYVRLVRRVESLVRRSRNSDPVAFVSEFEQITRSLEHLAAPPGDWSQLRDDAARELKRRLVMMRLTTTPSPESLEAARAQWLAIERRFGRMVKVKAGFWAGWPRLTSRSDD